MSGFLADLHFLRPAWLALLPVLPLLLWMRRRRRDRGAWRAHCDPALLAYLAEPAPPAGRRGLVPLLLAGWLLAVLALAGPAWERAELPVYRSAHARVLVLDLSRSMDATDVVPSRLVRARFKTADLLTRSADGMVGLVAFAGDAFALAPLTEDVNTLLNLLPPLETALMPVQGSRADLGLRMALELLERAGVSGGDVLLVTDGAPPEAVDAARAARDAGHRVGVLAVGTAGGAPIPDREGGFFKDAAGNIVVPGVDYGRLVAVAEAGGGRFATLSPDDSDIDRLLIAADLPAERTAQDDPRTSLRFRDGGPWLLLALLPLAALGFRRGWLLGVAAVALALPPAPAVAFEWPDLWLRPEQQVREALQAGDTETAAAAAADAPAGWQGAARYRAGDYAAAAEAFAGGDDATAHYNRGNALAREGRLEEALAAYDAALSRAPDMEDALFNRDLVQRALAADESSDPQQQERQDEGEPADPGEQPSDQTSDRPGEAGDAEADAGAGDREGAGGEGGGEQDAGDGGDRHASSGAGEMGEPVAPEDSGEARSGDTGEDAAERAESGRAGDDRDDDGRATTAAEAADGRDGEPRDSAGAAAAEAAEIDPERAARVERLLRRVPDDPGGLLRRKFAMEQVRRARDRDREAQPW